MLLPPLPPLLPLLTRLSLLLLSGLWTLSCALTPEQEDSWDDSAALSNGLCYYGNGVECCWGWRQTEQGRCQPYCQQGCKHGVCVGADRCKCHPGYSGKACNQDLNECGLKPRPCKYRCMNTLGSYKCFCQDGYALQPDGSCRNTRTCYHANCQYGCAVSKGVVRCTCPSPGLRLGPDRRSCVDVDECASGATAACPRGRKCVNTFGSFLCKCHHGFRLTYVDGRYTCIDKDTRPFCSLNPSSPKCRCKGRKCSVVPKVTLVPQRPRSATTTMATSSAVTMATTTTPSTTPTTTSSTSITSPTAPPTTPSTTPSTPPTPSSTTLPTTPSTPPTTPSTTPPTTPSTTPPTTPSTPHTTPSTTPPTTPSTPPTTPSTTPPTTSSTTPPTTLSTPPTTPSTTPPTTPSTAPSTTPPPTTPPATTPSTTPSTTPPTAPATTPTIPVTTPTSTTKLPTTPAAMVTTTLSNRIDKEVTHKQRGDVHIPRHPDQNQVWDFDIELGNTADGESKDDPDVGLLRCSFEGGLCDWLSDRVGGDLYWETSGDDSAGGRSLSVPELKPGQRSVRGARLAARVPLPWGGGDLCFSFSHWLTGHHVGSLQLFVKERGRGQRYSPALWSRTSGHGWRHTEVTLTTPPLDTVLLKVERKPRRRGRISIDDVSLRPGACR